MILRRRQRGATPRPADLCPDDGTTESLIHNVSVLLDREIAVVTVPMPVGLAGFWTSAGDREVIALDEGSSEIRQRVTLCHEVAHLVLGHRGGDDTQTSTPELDVLSAALPDLDPRLIKQTLYRSGCDLGDDAEEHAAETFATDLFVGLESARRAQSNRRNRFN